MSGTRRQSSDGRPGLRGLIFDMGDVFCDVTHWRRAVAVDLQRRGCDVTYDLFVERWEALLVPVYKGQQDYWQAFADLVRSLGADPTKVEEVQAEARRIARTLPPRVLFDGVTETLRALSERGIKLAVLSDTESTEAKVRSSLSQLGIEAPFDAVLTSCDLKAAKPEPAAFDAAVSALQLDRSDCGFVGHDIDELTGAQAFGLRAIAFNHTVGAPADHYLDRFELLLDLVA